MDEDYLVADPNRGRDVDVYFVAFMSKKLLIKPQYIENAKNHFENPKLKIGSSGSILLKTMCDLNAIFLANNEEMPIEEFEINVGLAQAALGSLLSDRRHGKAVYQPQPIIMPEENRMAIFNRMSESESTHDWYN